MSPHGVQPAKPRLFPEPYVEKGVVGHSSFDAQAGQNLSELVCLLPGKYFFLCLVARSHSPVLARKPLGRAP